ncbi:glutamic acid-rich protein-like isoform X4 [Salvia divinorum]|uniref:Glutamic acid-rich protein-like isoform X4 n=1 Tax=Salvia divinorum TaxID=28513 RepID=A0ABD1IG32_SALDI
MISFDKHLQVTTDKQPVCHLIMVDKDHMPADDLCGKHIVKKIKLDNEIDLNKLDQFVKLEEKYEGTEEENEEEEEEKVEEKENEEDGELSDYGDYEQGKYFDDEDDDYNVIEEYEEAIF